MLRALMLTLATSIPLACAGNVAPPTASPVAATSSAKAAASAKPPVKDSLAAERVVDDDGMRFRVEAIARHEKAGWQVDVTVRAQPTDGGKHRLLGLGNSLNLFAQVQTGDDGWASGEGGGGTPPRVVPPNGDITLVRPWDFEKSVHVGDVLRLSVKTYHEGTSQEDHPLMLATVVLDVTNGQSPRLTVEASLPDDEQPG